MEPIINLLFLLTLSFLFCHELDAIQHHEWRLFPFLNRFEDDIAYRIFTLLHIPLFAIFFWYIANPAVSFIIFVDIFAVVHLGLHYWFRSHPLYEFKGFVSNLFIVGTAVTGASHLALFLIVG